MNNTCTKKSPPAYYGHGGDSMFRNSILYRRLWYVRKRNIKKIHLLLRLVLAAAIMWAVFMFSQHDILTALGL